MIGIHKNSDGSVIMDDGTELTEQQYRDGDYAPSYDDLPGEPEVDYSL